MDSTQSFIPLSDIQNGMVILKDGSVAIIIETSAVNFDLLSENEQMAIIGSFAGLLNSLSFAIQIVIRSKKLDISSYLEKLVVAEQQQNNPLLKKLMQNYRNFVSSVIRENEVLDKQFFVVISISALELGILRNNNAELFAQKALTALTPRRDHLIRQLGRIGLKASQLNDDKLIRLFFDWYNEPVFETMDKQKISDDAETAAVEKADATEAASKAAALQTPLPSAPAPAAPAAQNVQVAPPPSQPVQQPVTSMIPNQPITPVQAPPMKPAQNPYPNVYPAQQINVNASNPANPIPRPTNTPFVVEELHD